MRFAWARRILAACADRAPEPDPAPSVLTLAREVCDRPPGDGARPVPPSPLLDRAGLTIWHDARTPELADAFDLLGQREEGSTGRWLDTPFLVRLAWAPGCFLETSALRITVKQGGLPPPEGGESELLPELITDGGQPLAALPFEEQANHVVVELLLRTASDADGAITLAFRDGRLIGTEILDTDLTRRAHRWPSQG